MTTALGSEPLVVVPLRAGKTRLSGALDPVTRSGLRAAMLSDVIVAVRSAGLTNIVVAAGDEESAQFAGLHGLDVHRDPPDCSDLNEAIAATVVAHGPQRTVLVVTADLPALTASDITAVWSTEGEVVLAPTSDGGTGALLRRPVTAMATAYGPESAALHAARAIDLGLHPVVLDLPGFRVDVDTAEDLSWLSRTTDLGQATRQWLARADVA